VAILIGRLKNRLQLANADLYLVSSLDRHEADGTTAIARAPRTPGMRIGALSSYVPALTAADSLADGNQSSLQRNGG
jgi:hypothetical protein